MMSGLLGQDENHGVVQSSNSVWMARNPNDSDWEKWNDWGIAGILYPNLHLHGVGGGSSRSLDGISEGHHDPHRSAFGVQAFEPGVSLRSKYLEGYVNYLGYQTAQGDWDGEFEEAFLKWIEIPGGFELKGGQYLSRFGSLNAIHLHGWDFVDSETVLTRFLGEHGLSMTGGELSWTLPLGMEPGLVSIFTMGFGQAVEIDHGNEHGHGHEHAGEEVMHDPEGAWMKDDVMTARWMARYRYSDFKSVTAGVSAALGHNGYGKSTGVYGLDFEYLWRENGLEAGGKAFRWRNEWLLRVVNAYSEHDEDGNGSIDEVFSGTYDELGMYSHLIYTWNTHFDSGLRLGWVSGMSEMGLEDRLRVSPSCVWWLDQGRRIGVRAQYNWDLVGGSEQEHAIWFQLNIGLGNANEVR